MRWLTNKREVKEASPSVLVAIESLVESRPSGREGRLFDLVILSLFLHSAGSKHEMVGAFLDQAPAVTEAIFVYPMILDKKRDILSANALEGIVNPLLERVMVSLIHI